ncbi:hypothetical protein BDB00DRAFT_790125 [Zychaea mexicana]|uniref:uncharacterized protein n=1 Tax=Zychaea mexicana TaxID=64656 RepID=UPI0022FE4D2F|nr:uncharacterized protein BDB00DRAFT_790125 [Zychaea mexicana]KAI9490740.1 hypothetical protein BDB00DRAFT_790125 [Zychaea mexicana]
MVHRLIGTTLALATTAVLATAEEQQNALTIEDFKLEAILSSLLILIVVIWYSGSSANGTKAKEWVASHIVFLEQQFAVVGNKAEKTTLVKDGPADYFLYVTDDAMCNLATGGSRSDLVGWVFALVLSLFGYADKPADKLVMDVTLDKEMDKAFVFAILPKDTAQSTRDGRFDLKTFTRLADSPKLPSNLVVYTEAQKLADQILSTKVSELISNSPDFKSLIITSQPDYEQEKYQGDQELKFHLTGDLSNRKEMVELACLLPDVLGDLQLAADTKSKLKKNREELEKKAAKLLADERAEELARKKADAKKAEADRVKSLSPAEQRKWEEKERAREIKKSQKKRTKRS